MARIWMEGFEGGLTAIRGLAHEFSVAGTYTRREPGRATLSKAYARVFSSSYNFSSGYSFLTKSLDSAIDEGYFRAYFRYNTDISNYWDRFKDNIIWEDEAGNTLVSLMHKENSVWELHVRIGGSRTTTHTFTIIQNTWHKLELYFKIHGSTGAYELRLNDITIKSGSGLNTSGTSGVKNIKFGGSSRTGNGITLNIDLDDIALNDVSGSINNSWCGSGVIVGIIPKNAGNATEWNSALSSTIRKPAESGTNATNVKITGHGLNTDDVYYNRTRSVFGRITRVDADNFTTTSCNGQTTGDLIEVYALFSSQSGNNYGDYNYVMTNSNHGILVGDMTYDSSIGVSLVISVNGTTVGLNRLPALGAKTIFCYRMVPFVSSSPIDWEAVSKSLDSTDASTFPNAVYNYIQSNTVNDIDLFDMTELTTNLGISPTAIINAVCWSVVAEEAGSGSTMKPILRSGATDQEGSEITLLSGTQEYQQILEVSPFTTDPWTRAEIDGLESGIKVT